MHSSIPFRGERISQSLSGSWNSLQLLLGNGGYTFTLPIADGCDINVNINMSDKGDMALHFVSKGTAEPLLCVTSSSTLCKESRRTPRMLGLRRKMRN